MGLELSLAVSPELSLAVSLGMSLAVSFLLSLEAEDPCSSCLALVLTSTPTLQRPSMARAGSGWGCCCGCLGDIKINLLGG